MSSKRPADWNEEEPKEEKKVKVEERFCVVCQDSVSGEVAICPKSEHWVCAVHLKQRSFDRCPLCKTPWLRARDHVLDREEEKRAPPQRERDEQAELLSSMLNNPALSLEEMLARCPLPYTSFWAGVTSAGREPERTTDLALASDRNWQFYMRQWENLANQDRRKFYFELQTSFMWMNTLMKSARFWQWILSRHGEAVLMMSSAYGDGNKMRIPLNRGCLDASRVVLEYCRAQNFDLFDREKEETWVAHWLNHHGLEVARQMCELCGFRITEASLVLLHSQVSDPLVLRYVREHYPHLSTDVFAMVVSKDNWEERDEAFLAELMELKPDRPLLIYDRVSKKQFECARVDWERHGMAAPMTEGWVREWRAKEVLLGPPPPAAETKSETLEVAHLYMITFVKFGGTVRWYASDQAVDHQYMKLREGLSGKEICPPDGTILKYQRLNVLKMEKANMF